MYDECLRIDECLISHMVNQKPLPTNAVATTCNRNDQPQGHVVQAVRIFVFEVDMKGYDMNDMINLNMNDNG